MNKFVKKIAIAVFAIAVWSAALVGISATINAFGSQQVQTVAVHQLADDSSAYFDTVATNQAWTFVSNMLMYLGFFGVVVFVWYICKQFFEFFFKNKKDKFKIKDSKEE